MRINIKRRTIISGDDVLQHGDRGIRFSYKGEALGKYEDQQYMLEVRGKHRDWLIERGESTEIHYERIVLDDATFMGEMWLEFEDDYNGCEFKLLFL